MIVERVPMAELKKYCVPQALFSLQPMRLKQFIAKFEQRAGRKPEHIVIARDSFGGRRYYGW